MLSRHVFWQSSELRAGSGAWGQAQPDRGTWERLRRKDLGAGPGRRRRVEKGPSGQEGQCRQTHRDLENAEQGEGAVEDGTTVNLGPGQRIWAWQSLG